MAQDKEKFLDRWSRLKHESKDLPDAKDESAKDATAPPPLPPVEQLTPESDFTGFMHPKVEDALRRVALKKLFRDPHFNVPDPFEAYSGDWTGGEAIPDEMLATLNQARTLLFDKEEKKEGEKEGEENPGGAAVARQGPESQPESKDDEPARKDA
jgi:Protein of unknown function (DUF3306)